MFRSRKLMVCMTMLLAFLVMSGSMFQPAEMALNVDEHMVYQNENIEYFLIRIKASREYAKEHYLNGGFLFYGMIRAKDNDNDFLYLGSTTTNTTDTLYCTVSGDAKKELTDLRTGNVVKVYGRLSVSLVDADKWTMKVDRIEKTADDKVSPTAFSLKDGTTFDQEKMAKRELKKGRIRFWVPSDWEAVEKDLIKTNLGTMEGYQYCLNEIREQSVQPESLFVCYFDSEKHLLKSGDKKETELVERAIVKNILKSDPGAASLKKVTYYGATYHYYQCAYKTLLGQNYHAEFIFQPVGTEGFVVYLYVYREKAHLDGVMTVMRLLESD